MAFRGGLAEVPIGGATLGLTGTKNLTEVRANQLLEALNITFEDGAIGKEGGSTLKTLTPIPNAPRILGGAEWQPTLGTIWSVIYTTEGYVRLDYGSGSYSQVVGSGFSTLPCLPVFTTGGSEASGRNRKLFMCTGNNTPFLLEGTSSLMRILTDPPADWATKFPKTMCVHDNRLWGAAGHRVYYSKQADHEDFNDADAGSLSIFSGEGNEIIQIMSFKGILIVWKQPVGIYIVDTTDPDPLNWGIDLINSTIGGVSPLGAVQIDNDILFVDQGGNIQLLSGIQEYGKLGARNLSQLHKLGPFIRENVNLGALNRVQTLYYTAKREVHIALPENAQTNNTARLVVDFNNTEISRFRWSDKDVCDALWLQTDGITNTQRPLCGDNIGQVWNLDQEVRTKNNQPYLSRFQTAHTDLSFIDPSLAVKRKEGKFLELTVVPKGDFPIFCDIIWDGQLTQTIQFDYASFGFILDQDNLDEADLGGPTQIPGVIIGSWILGDEDLADWALATQRKRISGGGKRISLRFYTADLGADFLITRCVLSFQVGNERVIR